MNKKYDVIIIGAGIAGASFAAEIAAHASVLLLEAEDMPGYHSTGRSAAFWSETYGGPLIQPLTTASFEAFSRGGFLQPLGSVKIGQEADRAKRDQFMADFDGSGIALEEVDPAAIIPGLRPEWTIGVREPTCAYIDVAGLHADCLARAKRGGVDLAVRSRMTAATRGEAGWTVETTGGTFTAQMLVNAAGAWADEAARVAGVTPIGITPYRRTLVQLRTDPGAPDDLPHVSGLDGSFYFKPEGGGRLWLSPHDETRDEPGDVQPEELDVAIAIDRLEHVVDWRVTGIDRKWAGLRSFAPDRLPVYGFAADAPGYFWCVGQGGFGIQTAPAAAMVAAALLLGRAPDPAIAGIDLDRYSASRFA